MVAGPVPSCLQQYQTATPSGDVLFGVSVHFWPRLCKNQEILIRMLSSGNHRHPRSHPADCFQYLTYRTMEVCLSAATIIKPVRRRVRLFRTANTGFYACILPCKNCLLSTSQAFSRSKYAETSHRIRKQIAENNRLDVLESACIGHNWPSRLGLLSFHTVWIQMRHKQLFENQDTHRPPSGGLGTSGGQE